LSANKKTAKAPRVTWFIELLSDEDIVKIYKHFSGVTHIKFQDREMAEQRLINICFSKRSAEMREAMKKVGISAAVYDQYRDMLRGPIAMPEGPATEADKKRHAAILAEGRKHAESVVLSTKQPNAAGKEVLKVLRELIPEGKEGDEATVSSTDVAKKLDTSIPAVLRAAENLHKLKLVGIEDDSPNKETPFFWITLLPLGRDLELIEAPEPPSHAEKRTSTRPKALPGAAPGPSPKFAGKLIFKISKTNPRRENTHGWRGWELYENGMTYEQFRAKGGRNNDLQWDIDKKFIELRGEGNEPAVSQTEGKPEASKTKEGGKVVNGKAKAAAAGAVSNGPQRTVPKGQSRTGSKSGVVAKGRKVLRQRAKVR
jgi:ACT domain-containing protein